MGQVFLYPNYFIYDSFGRPLTKFDDSLNTSLTSCPAPPTSGDTHLATYTYGTSAANYNFGRPVTIQWGSSPSHNQESFTYDSSGRVTSHTRWLDGRAYTTTITAFDAQNRPTSLTTPAGETITTTYDWFGENSLTAGADALISSMGYNERGQLTTINRAASALPDTSYNYYGAAGSGGNESYRLQQIQSGSLLNLNYQYDALGNISQIYDTVMADSQNFTYDHLNRLITANGSSDYGCTLPCYGHTYAYNKLGNITSYNGQSYSYSDPLHKQAVTSISPNQNFGYDAHGNMTTRTDSTGTYTQSYDVENRLISVNKSGVGSTTFGYDANGQRTTTRTPDGTLTYTPFPGYEQSYPTAKQDTFPVNAANWDVENGGNWSWNSQFYVSNDTSNNALTTLKSATLGSSGVIAASIRANSNENGYLIFDYQNVDNYKYIGLNAQTDRWVFGQRVGSTNTDLYVLNQTVNNNQWYDVKVILSGNTAKLYVNGTYKAQYSYSATFTGGKVGLRTVNAITYFDNFLVSAAEISRSTYAIAGQVIATRISGDPVSSNNGLFYIFSDHLGSTSVLATTAGSQVPGSRATYYPFGSPRTTPTQTITDRNFTGQKENMELGLIYYNARYYVPGIARFLTPDTLVPDPTNSQSYNRYSYTRNSPLIRTDPSGHIDCSLLGNDEDLRGCNIAKSNSATLAGYQSNNCNTCSSFLKETWGDMLGAYEVFTELEKELGRPITYKELLAIVAQLEFGELLDEDFQYALEAMGRQFYHFCGPDGVCEGNELWKFLGAHQGWYDASGIGLANMLKNGVISERNFAGAQQILDQPAYDYNQSPEAQTHNTWRSGNGNGSVPFKYGNYSMLLSSQITVDILANVPSSHSNSLNTFFVNLLDKQYVVLSLGQYYCLTEPNAHPNLCSG